MMTVSEAELAMLAADKGRSASFCTTAGELPLEFANAQSFSDVEAQSLMKAAAANGSVHPKTALKATQSSATRRSQSCRVSGSRPPRAIRRHGTPQGGSSSGGLDRGSTPSRLDSNTGSLVGDDAQNGSYNCFLKKVGSCGRLVTLAPEEDVDEGSPVLRRSASARRPRPPSSPTHSPTPTRVTRPANSIKSRTTTRKGQSGTSSSSRRAGATSGFLEVRTTASVETLDSDAYLLRNFSTTTKGIVNRGDSFRRRRSRSNSVQPPFEAASLPSTSPRVGDIASVPGSPELSVSEAKDQQFETGTEHYRVAVVGATGVGKTALMNQFRTSECINAYDCSTDLDNPEETVLIVLNSVESEITFINITTHAELQEEMSKAISPNGWLVVYSVTDKSSFQRANDDLGRLQIANLLKGKVAILAGNKCELVRSRTINFEEGRDVACNYGAKFMEISVGMNHKCDELLVGILHQLRLKEDLAIAATAEGCEGEKEKVPWTRNKSLMRASVKAKKLVNRIIGKSDSKLRHCEDFLN